jgi:hypothetical protein
VAPVGQQRGQVGAPALVLHVQAHPLAPRSTLEVGEEAGARAAGDAVVQLERAADRMQPVRHREERRDADAAGHQQHVRGRLVELEVLARRRDEDPSALAEDPVHQRRAAAAPRLAQHPDRPAVAVGGIAGERVGPVVLGGDDDVDVRAGAPPRQRRPVGGGELVARDVRAHLLATRQHHREHRRGAVGQAERRGQPVGLARGEPAAVLGGRERAR